MKTFFKIVAAIALLGGIAFGAVMYLSSGKREIARQFVFLASKGDHAGAHAMLHEALKADIPLARLAEGLAGVSEYTEVSFSSISMSGSRTTLQGTATTAGGCVSAVSFDLLGDLIVAFEITPLCRG